jgi:hypothetical protein
MTPPKPMAFTCLSKEQAAGVVVRPSAFSRLPLKLLKLCREFPDISIRVTRSYPSRSDRMTGRRAEKGP